MTEDTRHPYDQAYQPETPEQPSNIVRFWVLRHIVVLQAEIHLLQTSRTSDELLARCVTAYVARLKELVELLDQPLRPSPKASGLR